MHHVIHDAIMIGGAADPDSRRLQAVAKSAIPAPLRRLGPLLAPLSPVASTRHPLLGAVGANELRHHRRGNRHRPAELHP